MRAKKHPSETADLISCQPSILKLSSGMNSFRRLRLMTKRRLGVPLFATRKILERKAVFSFLMGRIAPFCRSSANASSTRAASEAEKGMGGGGRSRKGREMKRMLYPRTVRRIHASAVISRQAWNELAKEVENVPGFC